MENENSAINSSIPDGEKENDDTVRPGPDGDGPHRRNSFDDSLRNTFQSTPVLPRKRMKIYELEVKQVESDLEHSENELYYLTEGVERFPEDANLYRQKLEMQIRVSQLKRDRTKGHLELEKLRLMKFGESVAMDPSAGGNVSSDSNIRILPDTENVEKNEKDEPDSIKMLAKAIMAAQKLTSNDGGSMKSKIYRDLPMFGGQPEQWPNFLAQFKESTAACKFTDSDNVQRLQKALKDEARDAVQAYLIKGENLTIVMDTLERRFGRPQKVIEALILKTKQVPAVRDSNLGDLVPFSCTVENLVATMENLDCVGHMANPSLLGEMVERLPLQLQREWGKQIMNDKLPTLRKFTNWLTIEADAVSALNLKTTAESKTKTFRGKEQSFSTAEAPSREGKKEVTCPFCSKKGHQLWRCTEFAAAEIEARWKLVTEKKLCFICLAFGHRLGACPRNKLCGVNGCTRQHHPLLHKEFAGRKEDVKNSAMVITSNSREILVRIVPITLVSETKTLETFAYLDGGSTTTLLDAEAAEALELTGNSAPLKLGWTSDISKTHEDSRRVNVRVQGQSTDELFKLENVRTVRNLSLPMQSLNYGKLCGIWPHLGGLNVGSYFNAKPLILLGEDHGHLITGTTVVEGPPNAPWATECKLGWAIHGRSELIRGRVDENVLLVKYDKDEELHEMVKRTFTVEDMGVKFTRKLQSAEDERALMLMKSQTKFVDGRYEAPVLWKSDDPKLPDNRNQALMRLKSLERRFKEDDDFAEGYKNKIDDYVKKKFASVVDLSIPLPEGRTWILPTFGVKNPNKPKKLRVVMDAAAKIQGVGLNDSLLKGPDYMCSLVSVLLNFRRYPIAVAGDIREMFHQVVIKPEDRSSQLFYWFDKNKKPLLMQMDRMIFGSISSPFVAQYVKNLNADKYAQQFPEAAECIKEFHYVDDCLASTLDEESAVKLIRDVTHIHKQAGFEIVGWVSNSAGVLKSVPEENRGIEIKNFDDKEEYLERMLGLRWSYKTDEFTFLCKFEAIEEAIWKGERVPTKREMLKLMMSIYDPLGFIIHFTTKARSLIQDVWRDGTDWDQKIEACRIPRWEKWVKFLPEIEKVKVKRCYNTRVEEAKKIELHVFADASSQAYGAVAYLVFQFEEDRQVSFVMAKSRVAPTKPMTIPKLELQAALVGLRLAQFIMTELKLKIDEIHFWSDSWTVICWLRSDARKFQQFVSNRVGEILEGSNVTQWHWVPTKMNPADKLTREETPVDLLPSSQWFGGPLFLRLEKSLWPTEPELKPKITEKELEIRSEFKSDGDTVLLLTDQEEDRIMKFENYSSFDMVVRVVARLKKYMANCLSRKGAALQAREIQPLIVPEIEEAEETVYKLAQLEMFKKELDSLIKTGHVPTTSSIVKLNPSVSGGGVMKMSGRVKVGFHEPEVCQPIILDGRHQLAQLLVKKYHDRGFHICHERLVNEIRQKYWITGLRSLVKKIRKECCLCKLLKAKKQEQLMGMLPESRTEPFVRPFTHCGVDYFGPIEVKQKRSTVKRYGCLFTCMTTRAVHLEVAADLSTDSCLMAIRRLMSRRGEPRVIYSDQGRNFVGASTDLKSCLLNLNYEEITRELATRRVQWKMNPPASPHMGGSWESLIKTVKIAMAATTRNLKLTDELLATLFAEIEWMLNSRPLTHVGVSDEDEEAITPNHLLIGSSGGFTNWTSMDHDRLNLRKQWKLSQDLADKFWRRWLKEYVPVLNVRSKWHKKNPDVQVGDIVVVADDQNPRNVWLKGKIEQVYPGPDGIVRVVDVKTKTGTYRRPVTKICNLRIVNDGSVNGPSGGGNGNDRNGV